MDRRKFLGTATAMAAAIATGMNPIYSHDEPTKLHPRALGLLIRQFGTPEAPIKRVPAMGF